MTSTEALIKLLKQLGIEPSEVSISRAICISIDMITSGTFDGSDESFVEFARRVRAN